MESKSFDVLVVGGGLVGSAFALDLIQQNPLLKIAIIEKNQLSDQITQQNYDSRIYAISPFNYNYLIKKLGVEPDISRIADIQAMQVYGDKNSKIEFDHSAVRGEFLAKIVEASNLQSAIYKKLNDYNNVSFYYTSIDKITNLQNFVNLKTNDDQIFEARVLVGADGVNSNVREQLDLIVEKVQYLQSGLIANFSCEKPHNGIAYQWFLNPGILAYLPLPENKISVVWSTDDAARLSTLGPSELAEAIAAASQYTLGKLELLNEPLSFPLQLTFVEKFYQGRVVLIGDAAHTIHPLAGQGVNLGFGDAWELSRVLSSSGGLESINEIDLRRYSHKRVNEVRKMQLVCHGLHRLFHNRLPFMNIIRNTGLNLANNLPFIKQALIHSAINY